MLVHAMLVDVNQNLAPESVARFPVPPPSPEQPPAPVAPASSSGGNRRRIVVGTLLIGAAVAIIEPRALPAGIALLSLWAGSAD